MTYEMSTFLRVRTYDSVQQARSNAIARRCTVGEFGGEDSELDCQGGLP
jgi:hypothetical protein